MSEQARVSVTLAVSIPFPHVQKKSELPHTMLKCRAHVAVSVDERNAIGFPE